MVISKLLSRKSFGAKVGASMTVDELDRRLDVATSAWPRTANTLVKAMRKAETAIQVDAFRANMAVAANSTDVSPADLRGSFYHVELRRIPAMDRVGEFRMARRYEFLRLRVETELLALGMRAEDAKVTAGKTPSEALVAAAPFVARHPERRRYLESVVRQLADLRNLYVEGALHIVLATVNRYRGLGVDSADLIQEGNASLFQAIEGFDWRRDVRFRTYAQYWVQQAVLKQLYNHARTVRVPIWVQKLLGKIKRVQEEGRRAGREPTAAEIGKTLGLAASKVEWLLATRRYAQSLDAELVTGEGTTMAQMLADDEAVSVPDSVPEGDLRQSLVDVMGDLPDRERVILRRRFGLDGKEPETLAEIADGMGITAERVRQLQAAAMDRLKRPAKLERLKAFVEQA